MSILIHAFEQQIDWCNRLGSPFTAAVLNVILADLMAGGITAALVGDWPGDPAADAVPLRLAGALHALVLSGQEIGLAPCYPPSVSGRPGNLRLTILATLAEHIDIIRDFLTSPPQTNEVGRSGVLLGGFLTIAARTAMPLHLLEIGASAGLNTIWDRYRYRIGNDTWGDPASPVLLAPEWSGGSPPLAAHPQVAGRNACDIAPVDLSDPLQRLRLKAFIWADQTERLARLDAAIHLAQEACVAVERADAAAWLRHHLAQPRSGQVTVLYHSIMWQYMPQATRHDITAQMQAAAARATATAPLAWLRFEPPTPDQRPELRLTLWPDGTDQLLATAHAHGTSVAWAISRSAR
jgi:hypothetical protein